MTTYSPAPPASTPSHALHDTPHDEISPGDIAIGVVIGRTSEYFDFFVFGIACVLVFPALLFPNASLLEGMLYAFTIFTFAFMARPVGTAVGMRIQRKLGIRFKLTIALFVLGVSTVGMAFLPSYAEAGFAAIFLLSLLRIGQGLALGGSWEGLPSLLALVAPKEKRGWYAMIGQLGAPIGFLIAAGLFAYLYGSMTEEEFIAWGWRYPFFVAFALNVVALFARLGLANDMVLAQWMRDRHLQPVTVTKLVDEEGGLVALGALAALASFALFHLVTLFPLSWAHLHDLSITQTLLAQLIGAVLCAAGVVASGYLADRYGRRTTLGGMAVAIGVFAVLTPFLLSGGAVGNSIFILLGFLLLGLSYGQASGTVTSNFSREYRYTGAALTTDMAWLFGAAFAPLVALGLSAKFGPISVSAYLLSGVVCTLAALAINRRLEAGRTARAL